jgi:hypothetical protein
MHIDKPGRDDEPRNIDLPRARHSRDDAYRLNAIPGNGHIGAKPVRPRPIDNYATAQDQIGHVLAS